MVRLLRASGRRSIKKEEDRTENRVEGEERRGREGRGEEITTTTTIRKNTL